jgi:hypothetical protein
MKKLLLSTLILNAIQLCDAAENASWNILVYMDTGDDLSHAAIKNITDLVRGYGDNKSTTLDVCIQIHCLPEEGKIGKEAYRYKVEKNKLIVCDSAQLTYDPIEDLVNATRWAMGTSTAQKHMIALWNHGFGILNPQWKEYDGDFTWLPEEDDLMSHACPLRHFSLEQHSKHKALMLQKKPKVYMSVNDLGKALNRITNQVLKGKKLDILGMDMCMMSMVEIGWQLAPSANYMIGSQDCELDYGWDYYSIFKNIGSTAKSPLQVAQLIVQTYGDFYTVHAPKGTYTHAATDLSNITALKENIDMVCKALKAYKEMYGQQFMRQLKTLRTELPRFCRIPMYTDLYSLYEGLENTLKAYTTSTARTKLEEYLKEGKKLINSVVVANCVGKQRSYVHGLSLYFPLSHIDSSYATALFAQESAWLPLLKEIVAADASI